MLTRRLVIASAAALLAAGPARASTVAYVAQLSGHAPTSDTGSGATGEGRIVVDTAARTVAVSIDVHGIFRENLWDTLVARPIGPIHLHLYGPHDHATHQQSVTLVFPVPYGPNYADTNDGLQVRMPPMAYAEGAGLLGSSTTFEDFMTAMNGGAVVLNVHTDAFHDGEISGLVTRA